MARVLLIGDEDNFRILLQSNLECAGHTVRDAGSFAEGQEYLKQVGADVVLTDLRMPESEFLPPLGHLRAEFPLVKIIVIATARVDFLAVRMMGVNDVLRQPPALDTLLASVEQALGEENAS